MKDLPLGEVSEVFDEWAKELKVPTRDILFSMSRTTPNEITIYTDRPGRMIGMRGSMIDKYKNKFNEKVDYWDEVKHRCNTKHGTNEPDMPYVTLNLVEVTRADFWLRYDPMCEEF